MQENIKILAERGGNSVFLFFFPTLYILCKKKWTCDFLMRSLCIDTGRAFYKAGPDIVKAQDPVLVFIRGTTNLWIFVERRYFEHF